MRILAVCTGNICRSALAESQLRASLNHDEFEVNSAGVHAVVGGKVPHEQLRIGTQMGLTDLEAHRGQQLEREDVEGADLILVATRDHRADVVRLSPLASARTFTFTEFAHLAKTVTLQDIEDLVEQGSTLLEAGVLAVSQQRGQVAPLPPAALDVPDPYGRSAEAYRSAADLQVPPVDDAAKYLRIVSSLGSAQQGETQ